MRIQAKDLKTHLARGLTPIYLVFGDEPYQNQQAVQCIRAETKKAGFSERTRFDIHPHFEWDNFKQEMHTLNLFSTKKLIECHISDGKVGKSGSEALIHFAEACPHDIILLIICGKLENQLLQSAWFTRLEKKGCIVQAKSLYKEETLQWLTQQFKERNLPLQNEILHLLYERTEGNLLAAAQAIEKLHLYYAVADGHPTPTSMNLTDITTLLTDNSRFTIFDLAEAILSRSWIRTNHILTSLKDEGTEPLFILWSLTREVRAISHYCFEMAKGLSLAQVLDTTSLWKHKKVLLHRYFTEINIPIPVLQQQIYHSIEEAKRIDDMIKGRILGNVWTAIRFLCYRMMGVSGVQYA